MNTSLITIVLLAQSNAEIIATVVLAIVAVISLIFGIYQNRMRTKESQSEIVTTLLDKFRKDSSMQSFFQKIDYGKPWYGPQFLNSSIESIADNTFSYFENVLLNKEKGVLKEDDFTFFKYYIDRIVRNGDTQTYFFNLYHFTQRVNQTFPYQRLVNYAKNNGFLDVDEFEKRDSVMFKKVLNF